MSDPRVADGPEGIIATFQHRNESIHRHPNLSDPTCAYCNLVGVYAVKALQHAGYAIVESEYVRQLEDALLIVWGELSVEQSVELRRDCPPLMDFCAHLHHSIEHEQAMVRVNRWAQHYAEPPEYEPTPLGGEGTDG